MSVALGIAGMPHQVRDVLSGRLDAALGMRAGLPSGLQGMLVRRDPVRILLRADSELARHPTVRMADLHAARWVLGSEEHTPDWVGFLRQHLMVAGITPRPSGAAQVPLSGMADEVLHNDAVAPWPDSCPRPGDGLVVRDLAPMPVFEWQLVWQERRAREPVVDLVRGAALRAAHRHSWLRPAAASNG